MAAFRQVLMQSGWRDGDNPRIDTPCEARDNAVLLSGKRQRLDPADYIKA
jgi:hypothetical protein